MKLREKLEELRCEECREYRYESTGVILASNPPYNELECSFCGDKIYVRQGGLQPKYWTDIIAEKRNK